MDDINYKNKYLKYKKKYLLYKNNLIGGSNVQTITVKDGFLSHNDLSQIGIPKKISIYIYSDNKLVEPLYNNTVQTTYGTILYFYKVNILDSDTNKLLGTGNSVWGTMLNCDQEFIFSNNVCKIKYKHTTSNGEIDYHGEIEVDVEITNDTNFITNWSRDYITMDKRNGTNKHYIAVGDNVTELIDGARHNTGEPPTIYILLPPKKPLTFREIRFK